jgi:signal recognition particle subunit SRP68
LVLLIVIYIAKKVFQIIKKSHNNYGIKSTDYHRYRNYCVRKIKKIRKSMNYKFGTKNKFFKKDIVKDNIGDKKILDVALWNS